MKRLVLTMLLGSLLVAAQSQEVAVIPLGSITVAGGVGGISTGVLSPDGKTVAFLNLSRLSVVNLETRQVKELKPDFAVFTAFNFAEDSTALYFPATKTGPGPGTTYRLPLSGGPEKKVEHPPGRVMSAAERETVVFIRPRGKEQVLGLANRDGTNERIIDAGQIRPWWEWSQDGSVLMTMVQSDGRHRLLAVDPKTGKSKQIASGKGWIDSLLWCWGDGLYFIRVDRGNNRPASGEIWFYPAVGGEPRQITSGSGGYHRIFGRTRDGLLVALRYRLSGDFWDGMLGMVWWGQNAREREAELVLIRPGV